MTNNSDVWVHEKSVDVVALIRLLLRKWVWIALSTLVFVSIFGAYAFLTPLVYRASVVMVSASADRAAGAGISSALGQLGGLASLAGVNLGSVASDTEEALAVLKSRQFTESFIREKNLLPILYPDRWSPEIQKWRQDSEVPSYARAYKLFNGGIRSISQDKKTGLLTLQIDWTDREVAAEWANDLVSRLNNEMRGRAVAKTESSLGYLEKELNSTSGVATRDAISRLIEAQVKQRMLANVAQEYAFRVVDKAMVSDASDPVQPRRVLILLSGLLLGLATGIIAVLVVNSVGAKAESAQK
jgi:uncharacterized protein involved in exopolysaccharide biosynthesis